MRRVIDLRLGLDVVRLARNADLDVAILFSQDQDLAEVAREVRDISRSTDRWIKDRVDLSLRTERHVEPRDRQDRLVPDGPRVLRFLPGSQGLPAGGITALPSLSHIPGRAPEQNPTRQTRLPNRWTSVRLGTRWWMGRSPSSDLQAAEHRFKTRQGDIAQVYRAPCEGGVPQRVRTPPGNCRSSR